MSLFATVTSSATPRRPAVSRRLAVATMMIATACTAQHAAAQCFAIAPEQQLIADDGDGNDSLGNACAAYVDWVIVGAPEADVGGTSVCGAAYAFGKTGGTWTQHWKLIASDRATGDRFGAAVALFENTAVVGAPNDSNASGALAGAAYIFTRVSPSFQWTQQAKLASTDLEAGDRFGYSVAIHGDTVIIGSRKDANTAGVDAGAAYVFQRSGSTWSQQAKLTAFDGVRGDWFGYSVAISETASRRIAIVGAEFNDNVNGTNAGAVYGFTLNTLTPGSSWSSGTKLLQPGGVPGNRFGRAVAASGGTVAVTALFGGGSNPSSTTVFTYSTGPGFNLQGTVSAGTSGDAFGSSVSLSGNTMVIGASDDDSSFGTDAGCAYLYSRTSGVWTLQGQIFAPNAAGGDRFGTSVSVSSATLVVGSPGDDIGASPNMGSATVFTTPSLTITQQPQDASPCGTVQVQYTVAAIGTGATNPTYQWQYRRDGAAVWTNLVNGPNVIGGPSGDYLCSAGGANFTTLSIDRNPLGWRDSGHVRCIVSNDCGDVMSNPAAVKVCYANCDCSVASSLTANDFQCFLNTFASNSALANCDSSQGNPMLTANDFQCFLNRFSASCQP